MGKGKGKESKMKIHLFGGENGLAFCNEHKSSSQSTFDPCAVTCKKCLKNMAARNIAELPIPPVTAPSRVVACGMDGCEGAVVGLVPVQRGCHCSESRCVCDKEIAMMCMCVEHFREAGF